MKARQRIPNQWRNTKLPAFFNLFINHSLLCCKFKLFHRECKVLDKKSAILLKKTIRNAFFVEDFAIFAPILKHR